MNKSIALHTEAFVALGKEGRSVLVPKGISREDLLALAEGCREMLIDMPPIDGIPEMVLFPAEHQCSK